MSSEIKKYKLKEGLKEEDLINAGFTNFRKSTLYYLKNIDEISVNISIPRDNINNEFAEIDVLDDRFLQPYLPFYSYDGKKVFPFLNKVICFL